MCINSNKGNSIKTFRNDYNGSLQHHCSYLQPIWSMKCPYRIQESNRRLQDHAISIICDTSLTLNCTGQPLTTSMYVLPPCPAFFILSMYDIMSMAGCKFQNLPIRYPGSHSRIVVDGKEVVLLFSEDMLRIS